MFEGDPVAERLQLLSQTSGLAARIHGMGIEVVGSPALLVGLKPRDVAAFERAVGAMADRAERETATRRDSPWITVPVFPRNCGHVPLEE